LTSCGVVFGDYYSNNRAISGHFSYLFEILANSAHKNPKPALQRLVFAMQK
jgi:hypothetical protein